MKQKYDVVVIGGGHAGCEAALASARMGVQTLLVTLAPNKIAEMSCNPSIGGVGKGQLVKELDALGGEMGINADFTGIQFRRLNTRKGSAVQSSRCQSDKKLYAERMQSIIASQDNLDVAEAEVKSLIIENGKVFGVELLDKNNIRNVTECESAIITSGTFMRGLMHCGSRSSDGGRFGEKSSQGLSAHLETLGFGLLRLKTGTPPRLIRESIDFSQMEVQKGDNPPRPFSFTPTSIKLPQIECYLTYTNEATHQIIAGGLDSSPLYSGKIKGIGPRYCPSIEDKVVKFPEKQRHQLFFEPEALDSNWIYPNGISTSLAPEVQDKFVRSIAGCADVKFARYGYAVEYDCIDPRQLSVTLESKAIKGLFFAGQVNGTSGYEEAASQGLIAGINSSLFVKKLPPFVLSRAESYIGVMLDDLVSQGVTEPYRMFTSRAEFRLSLREDNADLRLTAYGHSLGLIDDARFSQFQKRKKSIAAWRQYLSENYVRPDKVNDVLAKYGASPISASQSLAQLLKRPEIEIGMLEELFESGEPETKLDPGAAETLEIEIKYQGYIDIQKDEIARLKKLSSLSIPSTIDYRDVSGLSNEVREKLGGMRPQTLGDASRISGVTPAALTAIMAHLKVKGGSAVSKQN